MISPEELVQRQLDAFNAHDMGAFLPLFADDVIIVNLRDGQLILRGLGAFEARYAKVFADRPGIHARLAGRIVLGRIVVDHEEITDGSGGPADEALAIYEVGDQQIVRMWFVEPRSR